MNRPGVEKVIVLGIDGLDPNILEKMMDAGELSSFSSIRHTGSYRRLETTNPSQSPIAWSSIATGGNPGYHGIFDFIIRQPGNYLPIHSIIKLNPKNLLARRSSMFLPARRGTPFWNITSREGIPTTVIRWPITLPPDEIRGNMLSGLGVLDLKTTAGRYAFYTTDSIPDDPDRKGDLIALYPGSGEIKTEITGPNNSRVPMKINISEKDKSITVSIDDKNTTIKQGEWSDWLNWKFGIGPLRNISGIGRFYLESVKPHLRLYLSSIQVDPEKPAFPISYPDEYAAELARSIGCFGTLGIPEDTNALTDGFLDDDAFLGFCDDTMVEREKMLWYELERFKHGLLSFVFDTTDRIQHVYWSTRDPEHPAYDEAYAKKYGNIIEEYYRRADNILGRVLESVDDRTMICILSDHGFNSFRRSVNLNSWLVQNGLMVLKRPAKNDQGDPLFKNVIWEKTKAYALGFSSIYLNLKGREGKGIVNPGNEAEQLKKKLADVFTGLRDPKTGNPVIKNIYTRDELYSGPYVDEAPDLVVGFHPGYRASWQTAIGGVTPKILEDNLKKWSGDHIFNAGDVPGIFLINRKISISHPRVIDIAPTVLDCFKILRPETIEGNSLLDQ